MSHNSSTDPIVADTNLQVFMNSLWLLCRWRTFCLKFSAALHYLQYKNSGRWTFELGDKLDSLYGRGNLIYKTYYTSFRGIKKWHFICLNFFFFLRNLRPVNRLMKRHAVLQAELPVTENVFFWNAALNPYEPTAKWNFVICKCLFNSSKLINTGNFSKDLLVAVLTF